MTIESNSQHVYLAKINEGQVLRAIRDQGPSSRADVVRYSGLSAPTVSKAAASLLKAGLIEEVEASAPVIGRPAMKLRLATASAQVLGVVIDIGRCSVVASGLDGHLCEERTRRVETMGSYGDLIDALVEDARALMMQPGVKTLGVGVTVPGLIDLRRGLDILSPNLRVIDGRSPGRDLGERLGLEFVMVQDQHALCLAERHFGQARGLDDFAILDVSSGVGMGVMSGGRLLRGHSGFAGEIGTSRSTPRADPAAAAIAAAWRPSSATPRWPVGSRAGSAGRSTSTRSCAWSSPESSIRTRIVAISSSTWRSAWPW